MSIFKELITPSYVKSQFPEISDNLDDTFLVHSISKCQRMRMRDLIGKVYLQDLMTTIYNSGETALSVADQEVMNDYFKPILALYAYSDAIESIAYQIDNSGVRIKSVDESVQAEDKIIIRKQAYIKKEISDYEEQFHNFMRGNVSLYPLYNVCDNDTPKRTTNDFSGIYFSVKPNENSNGYDWNTKQI